MKAFYFNKAKLASLCLGFVVLGFFIITLFISFSKNNGDQLRLFGFLYILIALLYGVLMGTLHLNGGRVSYLYLFIYLVVSIIYMLPPNIIRVAFDYSSGYPIACLFGLQTIGAVHCYFKAKKNKHLEALKWYARGYVLIPIFTFFFLVIFVFLFLGTFGCSWETPTSDFSCEAIQANMESP